MAKLIELNYQGSRGTGSEMWGLHAEGCRDVRIIWPIRQIETAVENRKFHCVIDHFEANSLKEALDYVLDEEIRELGWNEDHVYVAPCVKRAFRKVAA